MTTNFHFKSQNSKKLVIGGVMGVHMKNLQCSSIGNVVNLEFIMVKIHLNANDYFIKFHVSKLPKLSYIDVGLLTLNLRIFR